jgi:hypothetical protein
MLVCGHSSGGGGGVNIGARVARSKKDKFGHKQFQKGQMAILIGAPIHKIKIFLKKS